MKIIVYISLVLGCLLIGSNNKTSDERKTGVNTKQKEMIKENKTGAIYPALLNELESLIVYNDSVNKENEYNINIYIVFFSKKVDGCYITMSTAHFYDSYHLVGYTMINNKMIAFYNPESECNKGLVDINKLKEGKPDGFFDENSKQARDFYEPNGRKYKIHSRDSLELVYNGYL